MSDSYTQEGRLLNFSSPLGTDVLLANSFKGVEGISEPFCFDVELLSLPEFSIDPASLVGRRASLQMLLDSATGEVRYFNGIIASFRTAGGDDYFLRHRVQMRPSLWLLSLNMQTRVFQNKTAVQIAKEILEPYSITPNDETEGPYPSLDYCTQYRETDLEFLSRLLQQHGIFYYFIHSEFDHKLVIADRVSLLTRCPGKSSYQFRSGSYLEDALTEGVIKEFAAESQWIPGKYSSWDFQFMSYQVSEVDTQHSSVPMGQNAHEIRDFSDSASARLKTENSDAKTHSMHTHLLTIRREMLEAQAVKCHGASTVKTLQAGFTFHLASHPEATLNSKYLLTQVSHQAVQHPTYRSDDSHGRVRYENTFEARPSTQPFRAAPQQPKPRVSGVVTGKVVTRVGEDTHVDRFGRVCVQFWWDHSRPDNTPDNTMVRVSQQWAGKGWGTYFWPRVDDEVLIGFIEGDPDAPIIIGSLYNGKHLPKYDPVTYSMRSGILTQSFRGGSDGYANELRFEDKAGAEQVFLKAEHDMDHRTLNDHRRWVGNDDSLVVLGAHYETFGKNYESSVSGNRIESVHGNISTSAGEQVIITAGDRFSISVAGSLLTLGPEGVVISGPMVHINSGGSASIALGPPRAPDVADNGSKGGKM